MKIPKKKIERAKRKVFLTGKNLVQNLKDQVPDKKVLFVFGCQRSGTNMILEIFERDMNAKTYEEFSKLSDKDKFKIRLNPLPEVKEEINKDKVGLVVLKPLVESHRVNELLDYFEGSKALWAFRNYKDVASSNLRHFGINNGIKDLTPIYENDKSDWRGAGASEKIRKLVSKYYSKNMNPYDAAVLFWYVRNEIFFEQKLYENPDILMVRYEDLVTDPETMMKKIYEFIGREFPGNHIFAKVHSSSLGKGKEINISPEIKDLAEEMTSRLMEVYNKRKA